MWWQRWNHQSHYKQILPIFLNICKFPFLRAFLSLYLYLSLSLYSIFPSYNASLFLFLYIYFLLYKTLEKLVILMKPFWNKGRISLLNLLSMFQFIHFPTRQSWTKLLAFPIVLILLRILLIQLHPLQLWVNRAANWTLLYDNRSRT